MNSQPEHRATYSALAELCAQTIADIERRVQVQKDSDAALARQVEEEKRAMLEQERLAAEEAEKVRQEQYKKLAEERASIAAAEKDLVLKKKQLQDAVRAAGEDDEGVDGDDDGQSDACESTASVAIVSHPSSIYTSFF